MSTQEHEAAAEWWSTMKHKIFWRTLDARLSHPRSREVFDKLPTIACEIDIAIDVHFAAALADAVRVAREEDAKAVCQWCGEGAPAAERRSTTWWHPGSGAVVGGGFRYSQPCGGSPIRDLMPRARAGEGDATPGPEPCVTCAGEGEIETGQTTSARCVDCAGTGRATPPKKGRGDEHNDGLQVRPLRQDAGESDPKVEEG